MILEKVILQKSGQAGRELLAAACAKRQAVLVFGVAGRALVHG